MPFLFSTPWALILILLVMHSGPTHGATCYFPNGDPVNNDEYTPCRNNTDYTMCCRTGGLVPDTCSDNGLCYNICDQMGSGCHNDPGTYWRESCTDRSWLSPYCLKNVCTYEMMNGTTSDNSPVTRCARNSKWCCGAMASEDCCNRDANEQFELMSTLTPSAGSTSSNAPATVTRTDATMVSNPQTPTPQTPTPQTPTPQTPTPQTPTAADDQGDDKGGLGAERKIGLGVGIGVGIPFVAATLAAGFVCLKKKHTAPVLVPGCTTQRYFEKPELDGNATAAELDATNQTRPVELGA